MYFWQHIATYLWHHIVLKFDIRNFLILFLGWALGRVVALLIIDTVTHDKSLKLMRAQAAERRDEKKKI